MLAAYEHGHIVAGGILNRGAGVVGISNYFFTGAATAASSWDGCVAFARAIFPDARLVGYESGPTLARALALGFTNAGPLRVSLRDS